MRNATLSLFVGLLLLHSAGCGATDAAHSDDSAQAQGATDAERSASDHTGTNPSSTDHTGTDQTDDAVHVTESDQEITLEQRGRRVHLEIGDKPDAAHREAILSWTKDALRAVTAYYGRPPVEDMNVIVSMRSGRGIDDGVTRVEYGRSTIRIVVGEKTDAAGFARDWVLTHEMVHTALPDLAESHHWLEEGLATYVEPIARKLAGLEDESEVWKQLVEGLPQGQPKRNDRGLDNTPTWGRTYWGGALFCAIADVQIRERTSNKLGLRDALAALVRDDWTIERSATIENLFAKMDKAVGVPVLSELYAQHKDAGVRVDLKDLWQRLGVVYSRGRVTFDDSAPQAQLRRAITQ